MKGSEYREKLRGKMDAFVHAAYDCTKKFPKEEVYGSVSQLRRAALSVPLNYVEGFARKRPAVQLNFFEIAYGSLKESTYLLGFARDEGYIGSDECEKMIALANEIGAMLWTEMVALEKKM